ncbi:hypothetical protein [Fodinicola feengrottensis]|uniref:Uncharacterized protein n=1 Tax=Fodinicola feengrottensis TaxID=435914 RepID=A0ABN2GH40_9ACTN|nr:hypothetical protein [Fodinicola feengrottensis]
MSVDTEQRLVPGVERVHRSTEDPPLMADRLQEAYANWWRSVGMVHGVLEKLEPTPAEVTERFEAEYVARREYATQLRGARRDVPEYLAADRAFPPLWPVPEAPTAP